MESIIEKLRARFQLTKTAQIKMHDTKITAYGVKLADVMVVADKVLIRPVDACDWESSETLS